MARPRFSGVKRVVAILSGREGVGASYVAVALTLAAASREGRRIGLLDINIRNPMSARQLGAQGPLRSHPDGVQPGAGHSGVLVYSADLEPGGGAGSLLEAADRVAWGSLDLLIIDLPAGPAEVGTLASLAPGRVQAILVTIPTDESRVLAEVTLRAALEVEVPVLGVVENMSGYHCGGCGETGALFGGEAGAALAAQFRLPFLGRIPFHAPRRTMEPARSDTEPASMQQVLDRTLARLL